MFEGLVDALSMSNPEFAIGMGALDLAGGGGFLDGLSNAFSGMGSSLLTGGLGFAGQASANATNADIARMTNQFNAEQAQKNRDFQQYNSDTAIRRRVSDLQAAGLNPMLAYNDGASSPSGSAATGVPARMESAIGAGLNSAATSANLREIDSRVELNKASALNQLQSARTGASSAAHLDRQVDKLLQEIGRDGPLSHAYRNMSPYEYRQMLENESRFYGVRSSEAESRHAERYYKGRAAGSEYEGEISRYGVSPARRESQYADDTAYLSPLLRDASRGFSAAASARRLGYRR